MLGSEAEDEMVGMMGNLAEGDVALVLLSFPHLLVSAPLRMPLLVLREDLSIDSVSVSVWDGVTGQEGGPPAAAVVGGEVSDDILGKTMCDEI